MRGTGFNEPRRQRQFYSVSSSGKLPGCKIENAVESNLANDKKAFEGSKRVPLGSRPTPASKQARASPSTRYGTPVVYGSQSVEEPVLRTRPKPALYRFPEVFTVLMEPAAYEVQKGFVVLRKTPATRGQLHAMYDISEGFGLG